MKRQDLGMTQQCWDSLWRSVKKWSRPNNFEEMFTFCLEKYFLSQNNNIEEDSDSYYSVLFKNACIDFLRKQKRRLNFEVLALDADEPIDKSDHNTCVNTMDCSLLLHDFMQSLSDTDRIIAQALLDDTSYEELRETLKMPMNTVKTRIHRRREKWKQSPQLCGLLNTA